jgi:quercetin dioxygenase-like cupin family protein
LLKTKDFEIGHHFYIKGFVGESHTHKISTEYNYILSGKLIASGKTLETGDIFIYEPNDVSNVTFLEDTNLIIIKTPSVPQDKYLVAK